MSFLTQNLIGKQNPTLSWTKHPMGKKKRPVSDEFGLRSPVIQETFLQTKSATYLHRSTCLSKNTIKMRSHRKSHGAEEYPKKDSKNEH